MLAIEHPCDPTSRTPRACAAGSVPALCKRGERLGVLGCQAAGWRVGQGPHQPGGGRLRCGKGRRGQGHDRTHGRHCGGGRRSHTAAQVAWHKRGAFPRQTAASSLSLRMSLAAAASAPARSAARADRAAWAAYVRIAWGEEVLARAAAVDSTAARSIRDCLCARKGRLPVAGAQHGAGPPLLPPRAQASEPRSPRAPLRQRLRRPRLLQRRRQRIACPVQVRRPLVRLECRGQLQGAAAEGGCLAHRVPQPGEVFEKQAGLGRNGAAGWLGIVASACDSPAATHAHHRGQLPPVPARRRVLCRPALSPSSAFAVGQGRQPLVRVAVPVPRPPWRG